MGWETFNLKTINPNPVIVPAKTYTFELLVGVAKDEKGTVSASAAIVNDGEHTGRRLTMYFPNPDAINSKGTKNEWNARDMVRLINALGLDLEDNEDPVSVLSRGAGNRFQASVYHTAATEEYAPQAKINLRSFRPAA